MLLIVVTLSLAIGNVHANTSDNTKISPLKEFLVHSISNELVEADGVIPSDFSRHKMNFFLQNEDTETVKEVLEKIYEQASVHPDDYVSEDALITTERSRGSTIYDFDTQTASYIDGSQDVVSETPSSCTEPLVSAGKAGLTDTLFSSGGFSQGINAPASINSSYPVRGWPYEWFEENPSAYLDTRSTARIIVKIKNSSLQYRGSGFMINDDVLATACHVIYNEENHGDGGWCDYLIVIPARSEEWEPYGRATSTSVEIGNYHFTGNRGDDWGIARLDRSFGYGYMGLITYYNNSHLNKSVRLQGYPAHLTDTSVTYNTLYLNTGVVTGEPSGYLKYCDAKGYGGMSGGPVLYNHNESYYIGGIFSGYFVNTQNAIYCAFDEWLFNKMCSYL